MPHTHPPAFKPAITSPPTTLPETHYDLRNGQNTISPMLNQIHSVTHLQKNIQHITYAANNNASASSTDSGVLPFAQRLATTDHNDLIERQSAALQALTFNSDNHMFNLDRTGKIDLGGFKRKASETISKAPLQQYLNSVRLSENMTRHATSDLFMPERNIAITTSISKNISRKEFSGPCFAHMFMKKNHSIHLTKDNKFIYSLYGENPQKREYNPHNEYFSSLDSNGNRSDCIVFNTQRIDSEITLTGLFDFFLKMAREYRCNDHLNFTNAIAFKKFFDHLCAYPPNNLTSENVHNALTCSLIPNKLHHLLTYATMIESILTESNNSLAHH